MNKQTILNIQTLLEQLNSSPNTISFNDVISVIENNYDFTDTAFTNGQQHNEKGQNSGSCKVFCFAQIHGLNKNKTLTLFGQYYQDVLNTPTASDHQNIRQFMQHGFAGLSFFGNTLTLKKITITTLD